MNARELVTVEEVSVTTNVSLKGNEIMQKFLARRIAFEMELRLTLSNEHVVEGFIAGFDEDGWIHVAELDEDEHKRPKDVLVNGEAVILVEETGRRLRDQAEIVQARIRDGSYALIKQCQRSLNRNRGSEDREVAAV